MDSYHFNSSCRVITTCRVGDEASTDWSTIIVMRRGKMHAFDCSRSRSGSTVAGSGVNTRSNMRLSISQSRRRRVL